MNTVQHSGRPGVAVSTQTPADYQSPVYVNGERHLRRDEAVGLVMAALDLDDRRAYSRLIYWARTRSVRVVGVNARSFLYNEGDLRGVLSGLSD